MRYAARVLHRIRLQQAERSRRITIALVNNSNSNSKYTDTVVQITGAARYSNAMESRYARRRTYVRERRNVDVLANVRRPKFSEESNFELHFYFSKSRKKVSNSEKLKKNRGSEIARR